MLNGTSAQYRPFSAVGREVKRYSTIEKTTLLTSAIKHQGEKLVTGCRSGLCGQSSDRLLLWILQQLHLDNNSNELHTFNTHAHTTGLTLTSNLSHSHYGLSWVDQKVSLCKPLGNTFVLRSTSITRGHNFKLFKPQYSLDVWKYSLAYRVIDIWNSLSSDIVNANSISVFKQKSESVDFTHMCGWSLLRPVCFIVVLFPFVRHVSVCLEPVCPDFCLNKWIWILLLLLLLLLLPLLVLSVPA